MKLLKRWMTAPPSGAKEALPERTALVRFRKLLVAHNLDRVLFKIVTAKTAPWVDSTIIASAGDDDQDGLWVSTREREALTASRPRLVPMPAWRLLRSVTAANIDDGKAALEPCPMVPARYLPTAVTALATSSMQS